MSTDLIKIEGEYEVPHPTVHVSSYIKTHLYVTSFGGGMRRGRCIQLSVTNNKGYIQLDVKAAWELVKVLIDWMMNGGVR